MHEMMVQPSLQGSVMAVATCCCYYCHSCFEHVVVAVVVLTMGSAMIALHVLSAFLGRCEWVTMVVNLLSALSSLFLTGCCFLVLFEVAWLLSQLGLENRDWQRKIVQYLSHRVVDCYCYYCCCCCVHVLCFGSV